MQDSTSRGPESPTKRIVFYSNFIGFAFKRTFKARWGGRPRWGFNEQKRWKRSKNLLMLLLGTCPPSPSGHRSRVWSPRCSLKAGYLEDGRRRDGGRISVSTHQHIQHHAFSAQVRIHRALRLAMESPLKWYEISWKQIKLKIKQYNNYKKGTWYHSFIMWALVLNFHLNASEAVLTWMGFIWFIIHIQNAGCSDVSFKLWLNVVCLSKYRH